MAWTTTKVADYGIGNVRIQHWNLAADAATVELSTGLSNVLSVQHTMKSMNSANIHIKNNELTAATASFGTVAITGCTSGDTMFLQVIGN